MADGYNFVEDLLGVHAGGSLPQRNFLPAKSCLNIAKKLGNQVNIINAMQFDAYAQAQFTSQKNWLLYKRNKRVEQLFNTYIYSLLQESLPIESKKRQLLTGFLNHGEEVKKAVFFTPAIKRQFTKENIIKLIKKLGVSEQALATLLGEGKKSSRKVLPSFSDSDLYRKKKKTSDTHITMGSSATGLSHSTGSSTQETDFIAMKFDQLCDEIEQFENELADLTKNAGETFIQDIRTSFETDAIFISWVSEKLQSYLQLPVEQVEIAPTLKLYFFEAINQIISVLDTIPGTSDILIQFFKNEILALAKPSGTSYDSAHDNIFYETVYFRKTFTAQFLSFIIECFNCANQQASLASILNLPESNPFIEPICKALTIAENELTIPTSMITATHEKQPVILLKTIINYYILQHCIQAYNTALDKLAKDSEQAKQAEAQIAQAKAMLLSAQQKSSNQQESSSSSSAITHTIVPPKRAASTPTALNLEKSQLLPEGCATPRSDPLYNITNLQQKLLTSPRGSKPEAKAFTYLPPSPIASPRSHKTHVQEPLSSPRFT
jgi:hypothetical protein